MNLFIYWEYAEWICSYTENLYVFGEYVEWGKYSNSILLFVYWEDAEWICSYTENTQNESVRILIIRGMNLYVYWEYAECTKSRISRRIRNKNRKYFRMFIRSLDGFVWLNHFKPKNLMQVYTYAYFIWVLKLHDTKKIYEVFKPKRKCHWAIYIYRYMVPSGSDNFLWAYGGILSKFYHGKVAD